MSEEADQYSKLISVGYPFLNNMILETTPNPNSYFHKIGEQFMNEIFKKPGINIEIKHD